MKKRRPTERFLGQQLTGLQAIVKVNNWLRRFGFGSDTIAGMGENLQKLTEDFSEITDVPRKFNKYFSKEGWLAHDSLNINTIKEAVDAYEANQKDQATEILVDYFGPKQIKDRIHWFKAVPEMRVRLKLIEYAFEDYSAERYYAAVPLLLMVIDGAFNDATGKGFHTDGANLEVWDSPLTADGEIENIWSIFKKGRQKIHTEDITVPYRNGILHGMDLGYDNQFVAAKCWCLLFLIYDWIASKKTESERKKRFEKETAPVNLRDMLSTVSKTRTLSKATNEWVPREISPEYIDSINDGREPDKSTPEYVALKSMEYWKKKNYGFLAKLFRYTNDQNLSVKAAEIRASFDWRIITDYHLFRIKDDVPVITDVFFKVRIVDDNDSEKDWIVRLIREDEEGNPIVDRNLPCKWKIIYSQEEHQQSYAPC